MSTIPTLTDRLEAATLKAENGSAIMHAVANGDATTEVPTESGPVPSINKWLADLNDRTSGAVGQVEAGLEAEVLARQQADQALNQALTDEAQARAQADQALNQTVSAEAQARQQADQTLEQAIGVATQTNTHAAAAKATPVDADEFPLVDSASNPAWGLKKLTFANLKAVLLAYFKGQFREKLTAARTYYVRSDGNDGNDGLSNTAGGAFATIQKAINTVAALDVGNFQATISIAAGTYAPFELKPYVGNKSPQITGSTTNPETVVISAPAGGLSAVLAQDAGVWSIAGVKVQSVGGSGFRIESTRLDINGFCELGACGGRHIFAYRSGVFISANLRITGSAQTCLDASYPGGTISYTGGYTVTISGTPAFSNAFGFAMMLGSLIVNGVTFSGAATGLRYRVASIGVLQTFGMGASYLPGNTAGVVSEGGQYL